MEETRLPSDSIAPPIDPSIDPEAAAKFWKANTALVSHIETWGDVIADAKSATSEAKAITDVLNKVAGAINGLSNTWAARVAAMVSAAATTVKEESDNG